MGTIAAAVVHVAWTSRIWGLVFVAKAIHSEDGNVVSHAPALILSNTNSHAKHQIAACPSEGRETVLFRPWTKRGRDANPHRQAEISSFSFPQSHFVG